jgi:hypothetical protein
MLKRIKQILTTLTISSFMLAPALVPAMANAAALPNTLATDTTTGLCQGANLKVDTGGTCVDTSAGTSLDSIISFVLNIFSIVVGVAAVIMITIGGLKYVLSGGDSTRVSGAKDTILFAIVGLVVVALAQIIVHFVLNRVSGITG